MARTLSNRPATEFGQTIGSQLEAKAGSRREFGRLLDQMNTRTRKPRRRRGTRS
jgi:hypothetical protein